MGHHALLPLPSGPAPSVSWIFCIIFVVFRVGEGETGTTASCRSGQSLPLLRFKQSLSSGSQTLLSSWRNGTDCCKWKGVSCDDTTGFVTELDIYNLGVRVNEPGTSLFELRHLRHLELGRNFIGGALPSGLTDLRDLANLGLSYCNFSGTIPAEFIEHLSSLTLLDLSGNNLWGQIPPGLLNHPTLQTLYLGFNNLDGPLPDFGNRFSALEEVYFSPNTLHGEIPASISNLLHLRILEASGNKFTGIFHLSLLQNMRNLSYVSLSFNEITVRVHLDHQTGFFPPLKLLELGSCNIEGEFPSFLRNVKTLETLNLSNNSIRGKVPAWVWDLPNLQVLFLSHNMLHGFGEAVDISVSMNLTIVDLSENQLQGQIPRGFVCGLNNLKQVELNNNRFTGNLTSLLHNCSIKKTYLDLSHNRLTGSLPDNWLTSFYQVEVLDLSNNQLHGLIPENVNISSAVSLSVINLNDNKLVGRLPRSLSNCSQLQIINFGNNQLSDVFPSWLGHLNHLHVLALHSNKFYGSIVSPFSQYIFPSLQILDISRNQLVGSLPPKFFRNFSSMMMRKPEIKDLELVSYLPYQEEILLTVKGKTGAQELLTILTYIDFSRNMFTGNIPEEIGALEGLYSLNLSRNYLNGPIPRSLGHLRQIESLDLSHNNLSGSIPEELTNDTFLAFLDLSYNNLQGIIPQHSQFFTFPATSFDGNPRLCGPPLAVSCPSSNHGFQGSVYHVQEKARHPRWGYLATGMLGFMVGVLTITLLIFFTKRSAGSCPGIKWPGHSTY
ncbi:unnamed protein product [Victoria cruziana]